MVGGYVSRYLCQTHEVITPGRSVVDACSLRCSDLLPVVDADYVINCIGVFGVPSQQMLRVNALFPRELQKACSRAGSRLIHVSTDGVFRGDRGRYTEDDSPDSDDIYGMSSALGEPKEAMTLRTSLIGLGGKHSLLDSVTSQDCMVGFRNHIWNGMTALEFARCCSVIIGNELFLSGVFHLFSETKSKDELIRMFVKEMCVSVDVTTGEAKCPVNRELSTIYPLNNKMDIQGIDRQLRDLVQEYGSR